jgi:hypothetical protein
MEDVTSGCNPVRRDSERRSAMALRHRIEYLRKEHKGLLELARHIEAALELAGREAVRDHELGLAQLRENEHSLSGVVEHCHADERIVESTLHEYAGEKERARNQEEHQDLLRKLATFRDELRFATVDRLRGASIAGHEFVRTLQTHVAGESELLDQIFAKALPPRKRNPSKKVHGATGVPRGCAI